MIFIRHLRDADTGPLRVALHAKAYYRLTVSFSDEANGSGLTDIAEEEMTSDAPTAQVIRDGSFGVSLTRDQVRWLHAQLGELVKALELEPDRAAPYVDAREDMPAALVSLADAAENLVGSEPDMPSHAINEADFEAALSDARALLDRWNEAKS